MNKIINLQVPLNEESPLQQYYDKFDIEHMDWGQNEYKIFAMQMPIEETNKLLVSDFKWRKDHRQNVVASIDGPQGKGKSLPFSYLGLLLGNVFEQPFKPSNIHFSPEEFDQAFQKAKPCQTIFKDEDPKTRVGMMSHMIDTNITDFEEQSRIHQINLLQAGVELRKHAHFFWFEAKHTIFDETGYPKAFVSVLKTPRYTNKQEFMWRGLVRFPMINNEFVEAYTKRKEDHMKKLKSKYGNSLNPVLYFAKKIFEKRKENLIRRTKEGFVIPIKRELMDFIIAEEIGTNRFTVPGYDRLAALLRETILKQHEQENNELKAAQEAQRELDQQKKDEFKEKEKESQEIKRKERFEFLKEKLIEEKRKNDLKEKALKLKEESLKELAEILKNKKDSKGIKIDIKKQLL